MKILKIILITLSLTLWLFPLLIAMIDMISWFFTTHSLLLVWTAERIFFSVCWVFLIGFGVASIGL